MLHIVRYVVEGDRATVIRGQVGHQLARLPL